MRTMYPAAVNSPETVTMGAIAADTTTVTVQDISKIPDPPNLLVLGGERPDAETVLVTAVSANTITIQRGVQGTARAWEDRTTIARNFTAYDYDALRDNLLELDEGKANKPDQFTSGNFAVLDADGNPTDSGKKPDDYAPASLTDTVAGQGQELQTLFAQAQQQAAEITGKADKVSGATAGHLATLDADGNLVDGGNSIDDIAFKFRSISIVISDSSWSYNSTKECYYYQISNSNIKDGSSLSISVDTATLKNLLLYELSLAVENLNGVATVYAYGAHPNFSFTLDILIGEIEP